MNEVQTLLIDDEFQSLIPPLKDDEYQGLEKSLIENGWQEWREPIITWNGVIVDGHNRYHICKKHNIKFKTREIKFDSRDAAKIWIIENQFGRRNLNKYDRGVLALQLEPLYAAEAKRKHDANGGDKKSDEYRKSARQISDEPIPSLRTDERIAKLAGMSRDTIRKVKIIEAEAAKGNETAVKAKKAVKSGEKSINKAYTEIRPNGKKSDSRPLCTICGKPIDEGDSYSHDRNKHKSCATDNTEVHRGTRGGRPSYVQFTTDGRRICSICGEPIEPGEHYQDKPNWHYKCGLEHALDIQRNYRERKRLEENITIGNVNEVIEHDKAELKRQLILDVQGVWNNLQATLDRYKGMGVAVTEDESKRIRDAIEPILTAINSMSEE